MAEGEEADVFHGGYVAIGRAGRKANSLPRKQALAGLSKSEIRD
jgi:hypothetical protein